jgi:alpha-ribazole phosphatase/probable phosphoglycerate mutase
MVTICLLRHGETAFNADGNKYCGRTDVGLTKKGLAQAERMCMLLRRAKATAEIACANPEVVMVDERLIEIDFGQWEGKRSDEFIAEDPDTWDKWITDPSQYCAGKTGENGNMILNRLRSFYQDILYKHDGQVVLVVAHNGVNRFFMADQLGMPLKNYRRIVQDNSALTMVTLDKTDGFKLLKLNA